MLVKTWRVHLGKLRVEIILDWSGGRPLAFRRYRVASREKTSELRRAMIARLNKEEPTHV
jgi:hypothetical protein